MKLLIRALAAVTVAAGLSAPASAGEVRLQIRDGRVTLHTKDASPREILAEWARIGQTRIVNAERVAGSPMTLSLDGVPEAKALDLILRSVGGYLAAPRPAVQPASSQYDRIVVLAIARPAAGIGAPPSGAQAQQPTPTYQRPARMRPQPTVLLDDQDEPVTQDAEPRPEPAPTAPQPGMPTAPAPGAAPATPSGSPGPSPTWAPVAPRPGMPTPTPQAKPGGEPGGEPGGGGEGG